jgi:hypothetical protein
MRYAETWGVGDEQGWGRLPGQRDRCTPLSRPCPGQRRKSGQKRDLSLSVPVSPYGKYA